MLHQKNVSFVDIHFNRVFVLKKERIMPDQKFAPVDDAAFTAFAQEVEAENESDNQNSRYGRNNNSSFTRDYEQTAWTGLEPKKMSAIRFLGLPPSSEAAKDDFSAREIFSAEIKDDNGKIMKMNLPLRSDLPDHDYILWQIIDAMTVVDWENKVKFFVYERSHPDLFNRIYKGGFDPIKDGKKFSYAKGWGGQQVIIVNCLDRSRMDWHRANKHSMLLSKNISYGQPREDGSVPEFVTVGVPSFGFKNLIGQLVGNYGNWERYDLGVLRNGDKQNPYKIINASAYKEASLPELPAYLKDVVTATGPLSDEELSWDRYNLAKLYAPTNYHKIQSRLGRTIKAVDAACGTRFTETLSQLVAEEKARWDVEFPKDKVTSAPTATPVAKPAAFSAPAVSRATPARVVTATASTPVATSFDTTLLKGWDKLSLEEKAQIKGVVVENGKLVDIEYVDGSASPVGCPNGDCQIPSPNSFLHCPACGRNFSTETGEDPVDESAPLPVF